jgi:hypothetical protein
VAFLLLYAISRVADLLRNELPLSLEIRDYLWYLGAIPGSIGVTVLIFVLELYILEKKTKFIITIVQFSLLILGLLLGANATDLGVGKILIYVSSFTALIIPIIYFQFGYKTTGETRKRSISAGLGFFIIYVGIVCRTQLVENIFSGFWGDPGIFLLYILFPSFILIGLIIYYISIKY